MCESMMPLPNGAQTLIQLYDGSDSPLGRISLLLDLGEDTFGLVVDAVRACR